MICAGACMQYERIPMHGIFTSFPESSPVVSE